MHPAKISDESFLSVLLLRNEVSNSSVSDICVQCELTVSPGIAQNRRGNSSLFQFLKDLLEAVILIEATSTLS